jgi:hypothetical protein
MIARLALLLALLPAAALAQPAQQRPPAPDADKGPRHVVFMHTGPKQTSDPGVRALAGALVRKGYLVRAPDDQQDLVGGPGVDYFADEDAGAARELADTVNAAMADPKLYGDDPKPLKPRRQRVRQPQGHLGLWLF